MPDLSEDDLKRLHARLEELGPDAVRQLLNSDAYPVGMKMAALKWLADRENGKKKKGD